MIDCSLTCSPPEPTDVFTPSLCRRQLPAVDIDPQLLRHIHRNAVSNAAKYGKKGGVVTTEIGVKDHWLTLRVINEPGEGHAAMCATRGRC